MAAEKDDYSWLQEMIAEDAAGLLDVPAPNPVQTPKDRQRERFESVNRFYETHGYEPNRNAENPAEIELYYSLSAFRTDTLMRKQVIDLDRFHLLDAFPEAEPELTLEMILASQELNEDDQGIFTLKHITRPAEKPDYIGSTRKCENFEDYKPLFEQCHQDIVNGNRALSPFVKEESIQPGTFFIDRGVLLYVEYVGESEILHNRKQARLRCIFDNGTESDILNWTLAKNLYNGGRIVSPNVNESLTRLNIPKNQQPAGYIYVLKSRSKDRNVQQIKDFYKIGFCTGSVENRIKNAVNEPTYLMAPVQVVSRYPVYDVNVQKLEKLIHTFFDTARVSVDIRDAEGNNRKVREWFHIPLPQIKQAIALIRTREITRYRYDRERKMVVEQLR